MKKTMNERRLDELRISLSAREQNYQIALRQESGEDEEWNKRKAALEDRLFNELLDPFYKANSRDPNEALYILGEARAIVNELAQPRRIIAKQESDREHLKVMSEREDQFRKALESARREEARQDWRRTG